MIIAVQTLTHKLDRLRLTRLMWGPDRCFYFFVRPNIIYTLFTYVWDYVWQHAWHVTSWRHVAHSNYIIEIVVHYKRSRQFVERHQNVLIVPWQVSRRGNGPEKIPNFLLSPGECGDSERERREFYWRKVRIIDKKRKLLKGISSQGIFWRS